MQLLVENPLASTLRIHSFSAHYAVLSENNMKSISTIKPAITENTEYTIIKVYAPVVDIEVGVSPYHVVSICFISLLAL